VWALSRTYRIINQRAYQVNLSGSTRKYQQLPGICILNEYQSGARRVLEMGNEYHFGEGGFYLFFDHKGPFYRFPLFDHNFNFI